MIVIRNVHPRKSLKWPVAPGVVQHVAAGERVAVHSSDFETMPALGNLLSVLVQQRRVQIETTGALPVLH